jgi:hypothetical protein
VARRLVRRVVEIVVGLLTKRLPAVGLAVERSVPDGDLGVVWLERGTSTNVCR